jgi:putative hemolysin
MKLLASILVLSLIGITPTFAEEMYPIIKHFDIQVDVSDFRTTNNITVNLNIDEIEFVPENEWENTEFHVDVIYDDLVESISHQVDMSKVVFDPIDNVQISTNHERYGNERLSFEIDNIKEIIPHGTENMDLQFELSSFEIQFDSALNDYYGLDFLVYGGWAAKTDFNLNDSIENQEMEEEKPEPTPAPMEMSSSTEEQMKLQQQAIEQAEQRKQQQEEQQKLEEPEKVQTANPASIHCIDNGGISEILTDESGGQYGVCTLSDGTQCGEWKYFRGECNTSQQLIAETTPDPEPIAEPIQEKQCGVGTILKDGYCKVISHNTVNNESSEPTQEQKGFFEWLMSLFGM